MPENDPGDYSERGLSVEERLAAAELRDRLKTAARPAGAEGRYRGVQEYDPVLRWHCRLDNG